VSLTIDDREMIIRSRRSSESPELGVVLLREGRMRERLV
jgi:hypothetical protein